MVGFNRNVGGEVGAYSENGLTVGSEWWLYRIPDPN